MFLDASEVDHAAAAPDEVGALAAIRDQFDRAAALSPEAGVAAYSLGDPRVLEAATAELVAWLDGRACSARGSTCSISAAASAASPPPSRRTRARCSGSTSRPR